MSMLAEPRSRQKWSDDPRNTRWASDKSKFGYQMLTKMGWSEGAGLGQTLQGQTSHVKIKKKKNSHGIGMKTSHDDDWIAHQDSFNALLSQLNNGGDGSEKKIQSLEERVRLTRTKIMYSKFVKSKDLSRASSEDLASIFGKRSKSAPATPQRSEDEEDSLSDGSTASYPTNKKSKQTTEHGFTTINSGVSVADYFAQKMAALKQSKSEPTLEKIDKQENEKCEVTEEITSVMKKKKKKKKAVVFDIYDDEVSEKESSPTNDDDNGVLKSKSKKKKQKKARDDEPLKEICEQNEEEEELSEVKKKKKKRKANRTMEVDLEFAVCEKKTSSRERADDEAAAEKSSSASETTPKKKTKKKKQHCESDEDIDKSNVTKKSKKRKRKHEERDEAVNDSSEEKKKKRKRKHQSDGEDGCN